MSGWDYFGMLFLGSRDCVNGSVDFKQCLGPLPVITGLSAHRVQGLRWHRAISRDSAKQNGDTSLSIQNIHLISGLQCVLSKCFHV